MVLARGFSKVGGVVVSLAVAAVVFGGGGPAVGADGYRVSGTDGTLAVQASPAVGAVLRWLREGDAVDVVCQVNDGGTDTYDHLLSRTWDQIRGGGWVYDHYVTTRAQGSDGFSPGVPHCGNEATGTLNPYAYPDPAEDRWVADGYGYWWGECTSFAAWALRADGLHPGVRTSWFGDAGMWQGRYRDPAPHVGDIAQWAGGHNGAGAGGHVAYVAAVYGDGTIKVEEYNWGTFHRLNIRRIKSTVPTRFLHF